MSDDKRDHAKPAGGKPAAPSPVPAKPGAGAMASSASPNAAKSELSRRGLDHDDDDSKPGGMPTPHERALLRLNRGLVLLAAAIGLFVIVGGALLFWQQNLIRGQLAQLHAESDRAEQIVATAGHAAEAAKKSTDAVIDMERAYLLLDASTSALPKVIATGSPVRIAFKNYGKTPATIHAVTGRYFYSAGPPTRMAAPQTTVPLAQVVADGVAAGPYDIPLDINDADLDRAKRGDGSVVAQALVVYADMLGETHETDICFAYQFKNGEFAPCAAVGTRLAQLIDGDSVMTEWHLAQMNVGTTRYPLDDPRISGFVDKLDEVNALADASPGFVWRLQSESGNATDIKPSDDPNFIVNMSVWSSIQALFDFVYKTAHRTVMIQRREWFAQPSGAYMVLWWVPAGTQPTVEDGLARLAELDANGPTARAFTFKTKFPPPDTMGEPEDMRPDPYCVGWR